MMRPGNPAAQRHWSRTIPTARKGRPRWVATQRSAYAIGDAAGMSQVAMRVGASIEHSPTPAWEVGLVARFNFVRNEECDEVVESVERFEDEIRRETRKKHFGFAELEESERDWGKLRRRFRRLNERDFLGACGQARRGGGACARPGSPRRVHSRGVPARGSRHGAGRGWDARHLTLPGA